MRLETTYLGLPLLTPLVASAGPLQQTVTGVKALADAGVGAVVLYSLFEEQIRDEAARFARIEEATDDVSAEATSFFPEVPSDLGSDGDELVSASYLRLLEKSASAVDIPVIASLNGSDLGGWTSFSKRMESAGAAALELNIYYVPGDVRMTGAMVEQRHLDIVASVKQSVSIPVAVKLSPHFSSFGDLALRLDAAGADGLVLFNRFFQPDVNVEALEMVSGVELSTPFDGRLPRTWIAALRGKVAASLAGTSGVATAEDVVKYLLAGADVVMTTSALVRNGVSYASILLAGLEEWMEVHGYRSVDELRGLLAIPVGVDEDSFERHGYLEALQKAKATYGSLSGL